MYVGGRALEVLDRLVRETGHSRAEVVAEAVVRYAEQREVLERLERIEKLLASGAVRTSTEGEIPRAPETQTAADRSLEALRTWASRDDDD